MNHRARRPPVLAGTAPAAPSAEVVVRVDALAPGGDAVGRQEGGAAAGRATFVALAAPGDRIRARLTRERTRVAWADLTVVDHASPTRVVPPCPFFGRCGGCQWQHVSLQAQRDAKREIVERALRLPPKSVPLIAPVTEGQGYRDRAQLVIVAFDGGLVRPRS
jgi:23S rRNA (uracil1939-C5)-methyltransferase